MPKPLIFFFVIFPLFRGLRETIEQREPDDKKNLNPRKLRTKNYPFKKQRENNLIKDNN